MELYSIRTVTDLTVLVLNDKQIFEDFVRTVSITVTEMFRDPSFFKALRTDVIPRLATYPIIKIWIAGCATGQEVYSTAIILKEAGLLDRSVIYATDINEHSLKIAADGCYPQRNIEKYSRNYIAAAGTRKLSDYYSMAEDAVLFDATLRKNIVFSFHNLVADQSFNEFQLIICRNVLLYFNNDLQNKVVDLFCDSLCVFGFLGLGDKESLMFTNKSVCLEETDKKEKIYRKIK